jgi:preprotein translocase subunit SecG
MIFIIIIHVIICIALIGLVLIQRGRGSGLVEIFQGVESMFGTKTSAFLTRTTTILSTLFFLTCLSLAVLSVRQNRSLMRDIKTQGTAPQEPKEMPKPEEKAPLSQTKDLNKENKTQGAPNPEAPK